MTGRVLRQSWCPQDTGVCHGELNLQPDFVVWCGDASAVEGSGRRGALTKAGYTLYTLFTL